MAGVFTCCEDRGCVAVVMVVTREVVVAVSEQVLLFNIGTEVRRGGQVKLLSGTGMVVVALVQGDDSDSDGRIFDLKESQIIF